MLSRDGVALAPLTTLGLGGPAARLVTAYEPAELVALARDTNPALVLGGGSNLVVADAGVAGTVLRVMTHGLAVRRDGDDVVIRAEAGEDWDALVALAVSEGLAGLEALSGVPGLVGATPIQNVGAYGQDVSQTIDAVQAYDRHEDRVMELMPSQCAFRYRHSVFKAEADRWVVLAVTYRLRPSTLGTPVRYAELADALAIEPGGRAPLAAVRDAVLGLRRGKGMVVAAGDPDSRSAGSFFTNPQLDPTALLALQVRVRERCGEVRPPGFPDGDGKTKVSAAWLIERSGFGRGYGDGRVGLSGKHVLALVNRGGASTSELLELAREIRDGVREVFGVELTHEPVLVGGAAL